MVFAKLDICCLQSFTISTPLCMCCASPSANCLQSFQQLADGLPYAKHVHSKLICSITHELMTGQTHPVMLPNGNVYSQKGIEQVAAANNGRIVDPTSGKPLPCCPPVQPFAQVMSATVMDCVQARCIACRS